MKGGEGWEGGVNRGIHPWNFTALHDSQDFAPISRIDLPPHYSITPSRRDP